MKLLQILFRLWITALGLTLVLAGIAVMIASSPLTDLCGWRCSANPLVALLGDSMAKICYGSLFVGFGVWVIFNAVGNMVKWPRKWPKVDAPLEHDRGAND